MTDTKSIGAIELSSIGVGYQVQDELLKAASVEILVARTICSGKYIVIFSGGVSDVRSAIGAALRNAGEALIDHLILPTVHESVFPALTQSVVVKEKNVQAMGIVEAFSGTAVIAAADAAAKAADIQLFRIHVAMALGGKGFCLMTGTLADVTAGVNVAAEEVRKRGLLVSDVVIAQPSRELFQEYV